MTDATAHIRRIFLDPKDTYSESEAAEMLGMEPRDLKRRIEAGEIEGLRNCCGVTVSREELISFAMDYWPQEMTEDALGDDLGDAIPALLRLSLAWKCASPASRSWPSNVSRSATASR